MGSITKRPTGWRAYVAKKGIRRNKTFKSKTEARDWIAKTESEIVSGKHNSAVNKTVADLFDTYLRKVSEGKKGYKWERDRINLIKRDPIAAIKLPKLTADVMADWRDRRLTQVSDASVLREWNLINNAFNVAMKEWRWISENPMKGLRKPAAPQARDRLISDRERELVLHTTGYVDCPRTKSSRVGAAFLFAIETAMRAGEIASIAPDRIDLDKRTCELPETKNGTRRTVALSSEALRILRQVDCDFQLSSEQISSIFRKAKNMAGIENLHFHDTRHQAITNLAQKLDVLDLARMVGIKDLKILMVYYNQTAEEIAKKL